eukprot:10568370-Heterocapsa_arctica.AAC.1
MSVYILVYIMPLVILVYSVLWATSVAIWALAASAASRAPPERPCQRAPARYARLAKGCYADRLAAEDPVSAVA